MREAEAQSWECEILGRAAASIRSQEPPVSEAGGGGGEKKGCTIATSPRALSKSGSGRDHVSRGLEVPPPSLFSTLPPTTGYPYVVEITKRWMHVRYSTLPVHRLSACTYTRDENLTAACGVAQLVGSAWALNRIIQSSPAQAQTMALHKLQCPRIAISGKNNAGQ